MDNRLIKISYIIQAWSYMIDRVMTVKIFMKM